MKLFTAAKWSNDRSIQKDQAGKNPGGNRTSMAGAMRRGEDAQSGNYSFFEKEIVRGLARSI